MLAIALFHLFSDVNLTYKKIKSFIDFNNGTAITQNELIKSIILIEDRRFYQHLGFDVYSICRAIFHFIFKNKIEGASTITQQVVRLITNERKIKISRKIKEIILSSLIEREYEKNVILNTYLINYEFQDCVGILSLCNKKGFNFYNLSINEISIIIARIKYPYLSKGNYLIYLKRVRVIENTIDKYLRKTSLIYSPSSKIN
jgi:membrane carboxypeptidase/penicillin-binding protein